MDIYAKTIQCLVEYSKKNGFPSTREWREYAAQNGLLKTDQLLHRTGKRWFEIRKELGFENNIKIKRKNEIEENSKLVILQLQEAAKELGEDFTKRQYDKFAKEKGYIPISKFGRLFNGKFNNAKIAACLPVRIADDKFSDAEIIKALQECYEYYNKKKYSEQEYLSWRRAQKKDVPHIETIRHRLGNIPELKALINLDTYVWNEYCNEELTEQYCLSVLRKFKLEVLSPDNYAKWAKENNMPTLETIVRKTKKSWSELKNIEC